ncbi:Baicalin-beta-D-glucuronidase [Euphorbia peplus]|nr:Baicalin-beta-D-glucuronidase [Euphorbia peplus]
MTAAFNHNVYCTQTLNGGNYGHLDTTSFLPNADCYSGILWHRGKEVLATAHTWDSISSNKHVKPNQFHSNCNRG